MRLAEEHEVPLTPKQVAKHACSGKEEDVSSTDDSSEAEESTNTDEFDIHDISSSAQAPQKNNDQAKKQEGGPSEPKAGQAQITGDDITFEEALSAAIAHGTEVAKITLAINDEISISRMEKIRNDFLKDLARLQIRVTKDNKPEIQTFTYDEALYITNLFFHEFMGSRGLQQVAQLITFYAKTEEDEADQGAAARAELLTQAPQLALRDRTYDIRWMSRD